jgi:DNA replication protein DnaC
VNRPFTPFRDKSISDFIPEHPSQKEALDAVTAYIENREENYRHGRGLLLMGPPGVGKTFLANLVLKSFMEAGDTVEAIELDSYIGLFHERFSLLEQMKHNDYDDDRFDKINQQLFNIRGKTKWVLLDDIGREHESASGWSNLQLFNLFRFRWNRGKPTLFTTNFTLPDLENRYSDSFVSLLHEAVTILLVEGTDHREVWSARN